MKKTTLGAWLKWQRQIHDLKQREVEARIGVDHSQYSKWENNHNRPEPESRAKLHEVFGTTEDDLVALGILDTFPGIDGRTNYIYAESITPGDRAAAEAHDRLQIRAVNEEAAPYRSTPAEDPRTVLFGLLEGKSDADVRKVIQIVSIMLGAISEQAGEQGAPYSRMEPGA